MKQFYEVNGISICVDDTGETGKKPLLLYHGLTGNKESMFYCRDLFCDRYRVICVDTRGHGESTHPAEYSLSDHAHDVHGLIRAMDLGKADVLGYSMGSYVALAAAIVDCSDIGHLVLVATKPSGKTSSVERIAREKGLDISELTADQIMELTLSCALAPQSFEKLKTGELKLDMDFGGVELNAEEKQAESRSLADFDNSKGYAKVTCKTLVIAGEYDGINPKEQGKKVADGIKQAEYVEIKDASHMLVFEKPAEFTQIVKDFLEK